MFFELTDTFSKLFFNLRLSLIPFLVTANCSLSWSQSVKEWKHLWMNQGGVFGTESSRILSSRADFYQFAQNRDQNFTDYLSRTWHDYTIHPGINELSSDMNGDQPSFNYSETGMPSSEKLPFGNLFSSRVAGSGKSFRFPQIRKPEDNPLRPRQVIYRFYGQLIDLQVDPLVLSLTSSSVSPDSIALFWNDFSRVSVNGLIDQLRKYRDQLGLNDWGYFQLVKATSRAINPISLEVQNLLSWGLMIRSGFDVRFAFTRDNTVLLFPSDQTLYDRQFVQIDQQRYYLDRPVKSVLIATCDEPFPDSYRFLDLRLCSPLRFEGAALKRKLVVNWNGKLYFFSIGYQPQIIRYLNDYPSSVPEIYFGPLSTALKSELIRELTPVLSGMGVVEGAAFLQKMVQSVFQFPQERDQKTATEGRFPDQAVATQVADSRTRAIFYCELVKNLLSIPVLAVRYPNRYSVAINLRESLDGDYFDVRGEHYLIADPTLRNAPLGFLLPELKGKIPDLFENESDEEFNSSSQNVWSQLSSLGAKRGGAQSDLVRDQSGNIYVSGYMSVNKGTVPFLACLSPNRSLLWLQKFEVKGAARAFSVGLVNQEELYVAGVVRGSMSLGGNTISSEANNRELFLAQFDLNGNPGWLKGLPIKTPESEEVTSFLIQFDRSGSDFVIQYANESSDQVVNCFSRETPHGIYFIGACRSILDVIKENGEVSQ